MANKHRRPKQPAYALVIVLTALITAGIVGGILYYIWGLDNLAEDVPGEEDDTLDAEIIKLEERIADLEDENDALEQELERLEEENRELKDPSEITHRPNPGWEEYFPDHETTTLEGETVTKLKDLLGEPPFLVRSIAANSQNNREIWVYLPYEQDPTGLYLFFKGDRLHSSRLDEFAGLPASYIWDYQDFWYD